MEAVAACLGQNVLGRVPETAFWQALPRLRTQCGIELSCGAIHYYQENARALAQKNALQRGDFAEFLHLIRANGHSSFESCQNVYCASDPRHQGLSIALALSQSILEAGGGAWRMQGGGFAGTIQAFVPAPLLEAYCAAIESVFGPGSCYRLKLREQGAVQIGERDVNAISGWRGRDHLPEPERRMQQDVHPALRFPAGRHPAGGG